LTIIFMNDSSIKYDLSLWDLYKCKETLELMKKDKKAHHIYYEFNIFGVLFDKKEIVTTEHKVEGR